MYLLSLLISIFLNELCLVKKLKHIPNLNFYGPMMEKLIREVIWVYMKFNKKINKVLKKPKIIIKKYNFQKSAKFSTK